mmetsp:Transcript_4663/g.14653  ORF Transcript_4663/g.14653 Transcript_4663/m.14653 type:complete len:215 (-) Transcript_4663:191-835(-)
MSQQGVVVAGGHWPRGGVHPGGPQVHLVPTLVRPGVVCEKGAVAPELLPADPAPVPALLLLEAPDVLPLLQCHPVHHPIIARLLLRGRERPLLPGPQLPGLQLRVADKRAPDLRVRAPRQGVGQGIGLLQKLRGRGGPVRVAGAPHERGGQAEQREAGERPGHVRHHAAPAGQVAARLLPTLGCCGCELWDLHVAAGLGLLQEPASVSLSCTAQ